MELFDRKNINSFDNKNGYDLSQLWPYLEENPQGKSLNLAAALFNIIWLIYKRVYTWVIPLFAVQLVLTMLSWIFFYFFAGYNGHVHLLIRAVYVVIYGTLFFILLFKGNRIYFNLYKKWAADPKKYWYLTGRSPLFDIIRTALIVGLFVIATFCVEYGTFYILNSFQRTQVVHKEFDQLTYVPLFEDEMHHVSFDESSIIIETIYIDGMDNRFDAYKTKLYGINNRGQKTWEHTFEDYFGVNTIIRTGTHTVAGVISDIPNKQVYIFEMNRDGKILKENMLPMESAFNYWHDITLEKKENNTYHILTGYSYKSADFLTFFEIDSENLQLIRSNTREIPFRGITGLYNNLERYFVFGRQETPLQVSALDSDGRQLKTFTVDFEDKIPGLDKKQFGKIMEEKDVSNDIAEAFFGDDYISSIDIKEIYYNEKLDRVVINCQFAIYIFNLQGKLLQKLTYNDEYEHVYSFLPIDSQIADFTSLDEEGKLSIIGYTLGGVKKERGLFYQTYDIVSLQTISQKTYPFLGSIAIFDGNIIKQKDTTIILGIGRFFYKDLITTIMVTLKPDLSIKPAPGYFKKLNYLDEFKTKRKLFTPFF